MALIQPKGGFKPFRLLLAEFRTEQPAATPTPACPCFRMGGRRYLFAGGAMRRSSSVKLRKNVILSSLVAAWG